MTGKTEQSERENTLARIETSDIVLPVVSVVEAKAAFKAYQELQEAVLVESDYTYYVLWKEWTGGRPKSKSQVFKKLGPAKIFAKTKKDAEIERRKNKSAFRKMSTFFNLSDAEIIESHFERDFIYANDRRKSIVYADFTIKITAPNGRVSIGWGACSANERAFSKPDHDIPATAYTRAKNRATSDMVAWGEVSAEEMTPIEGGSAAREEQAIQIPSEEAQKHAHAILNLVAEKYSSVEPGRIIDLLGHLGVLARGDPRQANEELVLASAALTRRQDLERKLAEDDPTLIEYIQGWLTNGAGPNKQTEVVVEAEVVDPKETEKEAGEQLETVAAEETGAENVRDEFEKRAATEDNEDKIPK